ncbi:tyrosine-type recombinase/integrase [Pantoea sp. LS15]|uniref:tyrosine-type recombinase/integrase n=1 Tax=Enterobacterales TaxID=91347 RepID=UPI000E0FC8E4|nr:MULTISPECIES: tyrosine-type recombinase/integrase [Enterobacterales]NJQ18690.1 tyrosine-type recombinase/integrase [Pantoea sp. LS15]NKF45286.1 tyrosine-type recombinase/integrase [Pantoea sp. LS15]RDK16726.1 hypothetical protein CEJ32_03520 [Enterobacter sp. 9-2]
MTYQLHVGRCEEVLKTLPDNSVDAIVTDPPYGLSFMNHKWDYDVPTVEQWQECLRVLKPGGHLLSFGGSRTYHRLVVNAEDAGFEIRDQILWIYGSGFPKSHNLDGDFDGWGTALKPAHEPIVMARKPFKKTVSANMAEHGTGAINIDACRIHTDEALNGGAGGLLSHQRDGTEPVADYEQAPEGRWPANIIHDGSDVVVSAFPDAKGQQGALNLSKPHSLLWVVAIHTGMRHGELCALAWDDIDLIKGEINVSRNLTRKGLFVPPKTDAGIRTITLLQPALDALKKQFEITGHLPQHEIVYHHREHGKTEMQVIRPVFVPSSRSTRKVGYYSKNSISYGWKNGLRRAGIRNRHPYQSRHTYACWSLSAGANPSFIATQMGHDDSRMVYEVYAKWIGDMDKDQVAIINKRILANMPPSRPHNDMKSKKIV